MIDLESIKKTHYISLFVLIVIAGSLILLVQKTNEIRSATFETLHKTATSPVFVDYSNKPSATIGSTRVFLEVAQTSGQIQKGLSGRPSLGLQNGMLFVFPKPAIYKFWMPNMHFPLDMIWIHNGKVVDISENVPVAFDTANPIFYRPKVPAQYVIEVNAGFSSRHGITVGDVVVFKNISRKQ